MLNRLEPQQKEYALRLARLKSIPIEQLTFDELVEIGEESVLISKLGLEVSETLNEFWSKFNDAVYETLDQVKDIGARVISTSLLGLLL
jgi:predicted transcriptional regulator